MHNIQSIEDEFFIIESENLELVKSKFYGYLISEDEIISQKEFTDKTTLTGNGAYIHIANTPNKITIYQDYIGSYGLYIYKKNDYFAISNSFLKLINFVKEKNVLTLNNDYSKLFLVSKENFSFNETLINEITIVPKDSIIIIDKKNKHLFYEKNNFQEKTIELNTKEGIKTIDNWFNKWISIFRKILKETNNIKIELDESLTSRIILSLLQNSQTNLNNINITKKTRAGDSAITKLRETSNVNIHKKNVHIEKIDNIEKSIQKSHNTKMGITGNFSLKNSEKRTLYLINDYDTKICYDNSVDKIIESEINNANAYSSELGQITENILWNNFHSIQNHTRLYDIYSPQFLKELYTQINQRNTIGKDNVEKYLSNIITLNPLIDTDLQKLKINNKQDIYAIILSRYNSELLNMQSDDENINQENIGYATKINQEFPLLKQKYEYINTSKINIKHETDIETDQTEYNNLIEKVFFTNKFKYAFLKYYTNTLYDNMAIRYTEQNNNLTNELNKAISLIKIIESIEYSQRNINEFGWLKTFITQENTNDENHKNKILLNKYNTARIDIKNEGTSANQIKILEISDKTSKITTPSWFTNEKGVGMCISSNKSELTLKIKCVNDGKIKFDLRTLDIRDRNNKRFPVYIDYISFKIDNQEILKENKLVWHDQPFYYSKKVYNNEIIIIQLKWRPFSKISRYK